MRIEDYALIGDLQTSALVGRNGSVDWLCLPRFDSASCFTALLGEEKHGRWLISPAGEVRSVSRRYREGTLVLETDFETADGTARVIDFMPPRDGGAPQLIRIVQGLRGRVPMRMQLIIRFGYGLIVPWVQRVPDGVVAQAGPDALHLSTPVELHGENLTTVAEFAVQEGSTERFGLSWFPSYERPGRTEDAHAALARTQAWWREWSERCTYRGEYRDEVLTSLIVLKALTDQVTGAIVAAPTTSLPEDLGGERNWDYRYTWLRDSVLTLNALLAGGYTDEALAFSDAVFRATAGQPEQAQIMYGIAAERLRVLNAGVEGDDFVEVALVQLRMQMRESTVDNAILEGRRRFTKLGEKRRNEEGGAAGPAPENAREPMAASGDEEEIVNASSRAGRA